MEALHHDESDHVIMDLVSCMCIDIELHARKKYDAFAADIFSLGILLFCIYAAARFQRALSSITSRAILSTRANKW